MSIKQNATITKIESGQLYLSICRPDACAACKAQSACSSSGGGKEVILQDDNRGRKVGDDVVLKISRSQGFFAIIIAYLVPVAFIIGLLIGFKSAGASDALAASVALGALIVYFILLRVFRHKFETELTIEIE